jgi:hypothetical protein
MICKYILTAFRYDTGNLYCIYVVLVLCADRFNCYLFATFFILNVKIFVII